MNTCIDISISRIGSPLSLSANRIGNELSMTVERIGSPLSFRCGLVCSTSSDFYINVPTESIWLVPDNDFSQDVVVYANVSWTIE